MTLAARVAARHMGKGLRDRVASRYIEAFEFSSEKERSRYLKEHPDADPSRHTVKKAPNKRVKGEPPPLPAQPGKKPPPPPGQAGKAPSGPPKPGQKPGKPPPPKPGQHAEAPEQGGHGSKPEHEEEAKEPDFQTPGRKVVDTLKGLSSGALNFLKKAPASVQKFFQDSDHRRAILTNLHGAIGAAPKKFKDNLIQTAKHEAHEFKLAGDGIKAVMAGGKMSKHQKHAVKQVTIHMGITAVAAAVSATGVGAGLAFAAKALARHIALKSVHRTFAHLDTASELHHIGHGILELMDKFGSRRAAGEDQNRDPYDVLAAIVMRSVQEELANLSDDDLKNMLEQMSQQEGSSEDEEEPSDEEDEEDPSEDEDEDTEPVDETEGESEDEEADLNAGGMTKEASALMTGPEVADLCEQAETVHKSLRTWIREFPQVLRKAKDTAVGLEDSGLVWQDEFGPYWKGLDHPMAILEEIDEKLEDIYLRSPTRALVDVANSSRDATNDRMIPQKARLEYAFGNPQFRDHPDRRSHIAYSLDRLEEWARTFEDWVDGSIGALHQGARKARRSV